MLTNLKARRLGKVSSHNYHWGVVFNYVGVGLVCAHA